MSAKPKVGDSFKCDDGRVLQIVDLFTNGSFGDVIQVSKTRALFSIADLIRNKDFTWSVKPEIK